MVRPFPGEILQQLHQPHGMEFIVVVDRACRCLKGNNLGIRTFQMAGKAGF